jgi:hypothetical protein
VALPKNGIVMTNTLTNSASRGKNRNQRITNEQQVEKLWEMMLADSKENKTFYGNTMLFLERNKKKPLKFEGVIVDALEDAFGNAVGNIERYLIACGLKEEAEIEGCAEIEDICLVMKKCANISDAKQGLN